MKRKRMELSLLLTIFLLFPAGVMAQDDMSFGEEEVENAGSGEDMSFDEGATEEGATEEGASDGDAAGGSDTGSNLGDSGLVNLDELGLDEGASVGIGDTAEGKASEGDAGEKVLDRHPIWAVQQVYALRKGRVDFMPSFGLSMNDPFVQHQSFNLSAAYYITEVLSIGLSFNWYRWLDNETDVNFQISRATHQTVPINEYFWGGQLNMTYVPMYGKFAFLDNWILHWDVWLIGGGGFIWTRPIPVIDPDYRKFDFTVKVAFNVGIGGRLYLTRFLAIYLELRDYIFPEKLESLRTYSDPTMRKDKSTWTDDNVKLTNNVMLQAGVSLFLPFTFDFKLPK